jgi:cytochrome oxidase Cu insertion factor (SCO1/SenC/PrrC family)
MRRLQRIGIRVAVTVALVATLTFAFVRVEAAGDPFEAMGVDRVDERISAPDLAFRTLDGREIRLHALRGKVVLLGFFTTA